MDIDGDRDIERQTNETKSQTDKNFQGWKSNTETDIQNTSGVKFQTIEQTFLSLCKLFAKDYFKERRRKECTSLQNF